MDFQNARHNMVESQVRPNRVTDPGIIDAMGRLPRELFVPADRQGIAYMDDNVPLGDGRALIAPMVLARLLQEAEVKSSDMAMVVGCGTGYSAAVLSRLAAGVVAIESDGSFVASAGEILNKLAIDAVVLVEGPLAEGCAKEAPYDVILIDGAVGEIPTVITDQLAEGGRLVTMVSSGGLDRATLVTKIAGHLAKRNIFEAGAPALPGFFPEQAFTF
jgi:protein-L-isoaspartate(D-aspartate) O-methyltransferase